MAFRREVGLSLALVATVLATFSACLASGNESHPAEAITLGTYPAAALVVASHLLSDDSGRRETGRRILDSALMVGLLNEAVQRSIRSPRPAPYQAEEHAFPSGHASLAFAVAAALSERESGATVWAYSAAAAVGWSREQLGRHTWAQVLGGALLGTFVGLRAGKGEWHLIGHSDAQVLGLQDDQEAPVTPARLSVSLWSTSF